MTVPYIFATKPGGQTIPLAELDANFAYLDTNLPAGPTGPTGPTGATGLTGATGPTGPLSGVLFFRDLLDVNVSETAYYNNYYASWNNPTGKWIQSKPTEIPTASVSASGALTIDRHNSEIVLVSLNAAVTSFTVTNWAPSGTFCRLVLEIQNAGTFNINAWPTGTIWNGGVVPTITPGAGKKDIIILITFNGGTTIFGTIVGQNYS